MKILNASILWLIVLSVSASAADTLYVRIVEDTVMICNYATDLNCACTFRFDVNVSSDTINVVEVDTASDWAYCLCDFGLSVSLTGLSSGNYTVMLYRRFTFYYPDSTYYIGTCSFNIGSSMLQYSAAGYQTECNGSISSSDFILSIQDDVELFQNYPNPFNPSTTIKYTIPEEGIVELTILDVLGKEIEVLEKGLKPAGVHKLTYQARAGLASGVYFYQIKVSYPDSRRMASVLTGKLVFMK